MDQVVAQALTVFSHIAGVNRAQGLQLKREPKLTTVTFPAVSRKSRRNGTPVQHHDNGEAVGNGNGHRNNGHHGNGNGSASNGNGSEPITATASRKAS